MKMKRTVALLLSLMLASGVFASCGGKDKKEETKTPDNAVTDNIKEEIPEDEKVPEQEGEAVDTSAFTTDGIIESIYAQKAPEFMTGLMPVDLSDKDSYQTYLGLEDISAIKEVSVSESMIGAQAYSLVVARVNEGENAKEIAEKMKNGINPRKWVCVEADDIKYTAAGDLICFCMISTTFKDSITADDIVGAFTKVVNGEAEYKAPEVPEEPEVMPDEIPDADVTDGTIEEEPTPAPEDDTADSPEKPGETPAKDEDNKDEGKKPADKPEDKPAEKPAETQKPAEKPAEPQKPAAPQKPAEKPAEDPADTQDGGSSLVTTKPAGYDKPVGKPDEAPATPDNQPAAAPEETPAVPDDKPAAAPEETPAVPDDKPAAAPEETPAAPKEEAPAVTVSLEEIVNKMYEIKSLPIMLGFIPVDMSDEYSYSTYLGLKDPTKIKEAVVSESMMGSQAYSLVVARVADGQDANAVANEMKAGIDPRKWVCVEANDIKVTVVGDLICFCMISTDFAEEYTAQDAMDTFKSVVK